MAETRGAAHARKRLYGVGSVEALTMGVMMWAAVVGAVVNIALTAVLAVLYGANARRVPTSFTAGLLTFAVLLLAGNVITLWSFAAMMPVYTGGLEAYVLGYTWAQSVGLVALAIVTWK